MNKIISIEEIVEQISEIRNLKKGFVTNFYLDVFKHSIWIKNGDFYSYRYGDTIFLIKKNNSFWNIFYNSTNLEELKNAVLQIKNTCEENVLMFDIIGNAEQMDLIKNIFRDLGLYNYCSLVRMSRMTSHVDYEASFDNIKFAKLEQAVYILKQLRIYFDGKTEQIPYLEELEEYIRQNHVLIYCNENIIIGFVIYEKNKTTQYLRYWFVQSEYRDLKIGGTLLKRFFYEGNDTKRQLFWVIKSNENAIKRYRHYGFVEENLFDNVYTNKNIEYGRTNN